MQANGAAAVPEPTPEPQEEAPPPMASEEQAAAAAPAPAAPQAGERHGDSAVLKLKGLPFNTSQEQVHDFFSGFAVKSIAFVGEPDGRPSGLAFAEFENKEEALKALNKNGEYIGERYVRLLHVPKSEMEEQVRLGTLAIPGTAAKLRSRIMRGGYQPGGQAPRGPPGAMMAPPRGPQGLPGYCGMMPGQPGMMMPQAPMAPGPYAEGPPNAWAGGYPSAAALNAQFAGMSLGRGQGGGRGGRGGAGPMMHPAAAHPAMAHSGMGMATSQAQVMSNAHAAVHNPTSSTVKVRGLPYRSSPAEILAFFQGFQYLPDSLQIGLDSLGRPSGEAWLSFINSNEALKSVRDLNRHFLGNRYLELSIC